MSVKEFYEKMHGYKSSSQPKPLLYTSILKHTIGRFEVNGYDLTYQALPGGNSILDIRYGEDLTLMSLWYRYREVYGIDISNPMIDHMQKQFGDDPSIHLNIQDVNSRLNFKNASFDTIITVTVLKHIFDLYHLVKESYKLLKTRSQLIVHVPNVALLGNRIRFLIRSLLVTSSEESWDGGYLHYFTRGSLKRLSMDNGFGIMKTISGRIFARLDRPWSILSPLLDGSISIAGAKT
tara:strand:+ start:126 stop:833 length:708 start_codon:yes stop_codon:yes gene_type:complete